MSNKQLYTIIGLLLVWFWSTVIGIVWFWVS